MSHSFHRLDPDTITPFLHKRTYLGIFVHALNLYEPIVPLANVSPKPTTEYQTSVDLFRDSRRVNIYNAFVLCATPVLRFSFHDLLQDVMECVCFLPIFLDVRLVDVPAGVTQEEGHTGFLIHPYLP